MNQTLNATIPVINPPQIAVTGVVAFCVASLILVVSVAMILFLKHTPCYFYLKYAWLWCYGKCCKRSTFYNEQMETHATQLKHMLDE